jgi:hypothetical protein
MPRGRPPDHKRRLVIVKLRAKGLSYRLIGQRLGVTRQCVHELLKKTDPVGLTWIACCACGRKIMRWRGTRPDPVFCLACLPSDATFGQRLRAYRVAAGLTGMALKARAGLSIGRSWRMSVGSNSRVSRT